MSKESISVIDQEGAMAQLLASAEKVLPAFVTAVNQLFDAVQGLKAANNWIEELGRTDWPSGASVIDWRKVTSAAAKLVRGLAMNSTTAKDEIHAPIGGSRQSLGLQGSYRRNQISDRGSTNNRPIE